MSIQLEKLAILDKTSGKEFISKDGKTRQVYQEKPITVEIEAGQKITEGYDYQVSLSGILSKTDTKILADLSLKEAKVMIAGYTDSGLILQGEGKIYADGPAFLIKAKGQASCKEGKCDMCLDNDMACEKDGFKTGPFYFPFQKMLSLSMTNRNSGAMIVEQYDQAGTLLYMDEHVTPEIGKHASKGVALFDIEVQEGVSFIDFFEGDANVDNLSIKIKNQVQALDIFNSNIRIRL